MPCVKYERVLMVFRDTGCIIVGLGGIVYQQWTGQVSEFLLGVYVTLLGIPAAIGAWALRSGNGPVITGQSSGSPVEPSPQPQSQSSSGQ